MSKEKLGLEPAFPCDEYGYINQDKPFNQISQNFGMSKRFYAACAAMRLPNEQINTRLRDDDMVEDEQSLYLKSIDSYFIPDGFDIYRNCKRYSIKQESTYAKRLVRFCYEISDELLKQEKL